MFCILLIIQNSWENILDRNSYFVSASLINHENEDDWEPHENDLLCNNIMYVAALPMD